MTTAIDRDHAFDMMCQLARALNIHPLMLGMVELSRHFNKQIDSFLCHEGFLIVILEDAEEPNVDMKAYMATLEWAWVEEYGGWSIAI